MGRFDLIYDGSGPPKMLEYNADTPTVMLESGPVQADWLSDRQKKQQIARAASKYRCSKLLCWC